MSFLQIQHHRLLEVFQVENENKHKKGKSENDKIEVEIFDDGLFHVQMVQFFSWSCVRNEIWQFEDLIETWCKLDVLEVHETDWPFWWIYNQKLGEKNQLQSQ